MTSTCNHPHLSPGTDQASNPLSFQYSKGGDAKLIWLSNVLDKMNPLYDSLHQSLDKMDDGWLDAELPAAKRSVQSLLSEVKKARQLGEDGKVGATLIWLDDGVRAAQYEIFKTTPSKIQLNQLSKWINTRYRWLTDLERESTTPWASVGHGWVQRKPDINSTLRDSYASRRLEGDEERPKVGDDLE